MIGVTIGALCGHCICTGIAVLGGRIIAQMISVKTGQTFTPIVFDICSNYFILLQSLSSVVLFLYSLPYLLFL